ncbi:AraC family transcriptional regulator [uncultured Desulfobacter sp.]|uniref:helix-turn-helix transcriptional regulator n=1 Tax=uncultured Desulfobacter sp. TaxID=240139 RepID=UPI0029F4BE19|nr:AraC family transcriptional regulator [uncultured Desulfobacter sp.]
MKTIPLPSLHPTANPDQLRADIPASLGQGGIDLILLKSGVQLLIFDWQINQASLFQGGLNDHSVGFGFCLDGRYGHHPACFNRPLSIRAGESGFFSFPKGVEILEQTDDKRMHRVVLLLDGERLSILINGDEDRFYPILKSLEKKSPTRMGNILTPVMRTALHQLHHCPYRGTTQQIFLEGKSMELIAHMMEQISSGYGCRYDCALKASDKERVHHAAHMLVRSLNNPPDIMEIARSVGLSRTKLFRTFRQTFGLTPFEYLRSHRLQMAMKLLQDGEVNVTQAALMVGYTNLSYFARAFKSTFGIAPSELRKSFRVT